jgi:hypothetical protein
MVTRRQSRGEQLTERHVLRFVAAPWRLHYRFEAPELIEKLVVCDALELWVVVGEH